MKYSKATNYALHAMVYLTLSQKRQTIGVEELAKTQNLSPTYLSKILTKLVKVGLIESSPGVSETENAECLIENVMMEAEKND